MLAVPAGGGRAGQPQQPLVRDAGSIRRAPPYSWIREVGSGIQGEMATRAAQQALRVTEEAAGADRAAGEQQLNAAVPMACTYAKCCLRDPQDGCWLALLAQPTRAACHMQCMFHLCVCDALQACHTKLSSAASSASHHHCCYFMWNRICHSHCCPAGMHQAQPSVPKSLGQQLMLLADPFLSAQGPGSAGSIRPALPPQDMKSGDSPAAATKLLAPARVQHSKARGGAAAAAAAGGPGGGVGE
ncbi:hypothetical protein COO60DRAFT_689823 [Scenedesmus sp. NREL 46B-D3]|nr:hypothetical protein COO60DRAFT_689823 [Scenedesmus sp. NREL 46B-D3]